MHASVCVCVCMCLSVYVCVVRVCPGVCTPAQTEWAGSVGWRGALWIPLQASSVSGPAKVSCLPVGGWGWAVVASGVWSRKGGGAQQHGLQGLSTRCPTATANLTLTPRMYTSTEIKGKTRKHSWTYFRGKRKDVKTEKQFGLSEKVTSSAEIRGMKGNQ